MDDLIAFIRQQIDAREHQFEEDERVARAATPGPWRIDSETYAEAIHASDGFTPVAGGRWNGEASVFDTTEDAIHIARFDPQRMLAEVEHGRREIAALRRVLDEFGWEGGETRAIIYLAQPFAGRDGWREEWLA